MSINNTAWFELLTELDPYWGRHSPTEVRVSSLGYRTAYIQEVCRRLTEAGAFQLTSDYDKQCGRTICILREPRSVLEEREGSRKIGEDIWE